MVRNRSAAARIFDVCNGCLMGILAFSCLYPLWYALCISVSDKAAANSGLVTIYPIGFTMSSYIEIVKDAKFFNSFWISVQRSVLGTVVSLLVLILMAYPLSKPKQSFAAKNILIWIVLFCMVFSGGLVPWYIVVAKYGFIDSIWGLVLGGGLPVFNLILMMNYFRSLPVDLEEAARVEGAGPWRVLFQIVVPCSMPMIATIILFTSVYHWNEFFNGLVLTTGESHYPLQTYIKQLVVNIQSTDLTLDQIEAMSKLSNKSLDSAKVFVAMLPMLVVYPFLKKYFVNGIMLGAVKE